MRPLRGNPEGRGFPGDLLWQHRSPMGLPCASRRFAHLIRKAAVAARGTYSEVPERAAPRICSSAPGSSIVVKSGVATSASAWIERRKSFPERVFGQQGDKVYRARPRDGAQLRSRDTCPSLAAHRCNAFGRGDLRRVLDHGDATGICTLSDRPRRGPRPRRSPNAPHRSSISRVPRRWPATLITSRCGRGRSNSRRRRGSPSRRRVRRFPDCLEVRLDEALVVAQTVVTAARGQRRHDRQHPLSGTDSCRLLRRAGARRNRRPETTGCTEFARRVSIPATPTGSASRSPSASSYRRWRAQRVRRPACRRSSSGSPGGKILEAAKVVLLHVRRIVLFQDADRGRRT